jgi:hypothetical protein
MIQILRITIQIVCLNDLWDKSLKFEMFNLFKLHKATLAYNLIFSTKNYLQHNIWFCKLNFTKITTKVDWVLFRILSKFTNWFTKFTKNFWIVYKKFTKFVNFTNDFWMVYKKLRCLYTLQKLPKVSSDIIYI